jgi:hypothetical protein
MKTIVKTMMAFALIGFLVTSCSNKDSNDKKESKDKDESRDKDENEEAQSEICKCADMMLSLTREMKEAADDTEKINIILEKYEEKQEKCTKLGDGKSETEIMEMQKELQKCPSFKKLEKIQKEMMKGE